MLTKIRLNVCQTRCTNQHVLPSIWHHRSYRQPTSHNMVEELGRNIGQGFGAVEYIITSNKVEKGRDVPGSWRTELLAWGTTSSREPGPRAADSNIIDIARVASTSCNQNKFINDRRMCCREAWCPYHQFTMQEISAIGKYYTKENMYGILWYAQYRSCRVHMTKRLQWIFPYRLVSHDLGGNKKIRSISIKSSNILCSRKNNKMQ